MSPGSSMRRRQTVVIDCGTWWGTTHEASSRREQSCQTRNTSTSCAATSAMPLASHELEMAPNPPCCGATKWLGAIRNGDIENSYAKDQAEGSIKHAVQSR